MFKYKIVQGINYPIRAYHTPAIMFIQGQDNVLQFNGETDPITEQTWINVLINQNNYLPGGFYRYQIFQDGELKENDLLQIIPSLIVDSNQDLRSKYKVIVDAIEAKLAGTATLGQKRVQVGDKSIDKYSAAQLLSLLDYFKGKLAEQEAGNDINPKTDQMKVLYKWTLR